MRKSLGAAVAASVVLLSAFSIPAGANTIVMGASYAHDCSVRVINGLADAETLTICSTALDVDPLTSSDLAKTLVNRGVLFIRQDRVGEAISDLDHAERIGPDLAEIYVNRGVALMRRKEYVQAIPQLDRGISLNADELEKAYYDRGIAKEMSGDIRGAYFDYTKASQLKPDWDAPKKELTRFVVRKTGG